MSLNELKNALFTYRALKSSINSNQNNRDKYLSFTSEYLANIGDVLLRFEENYDDLQSANLIEESKRYRDWRHDFQKYGYGITKEELQEYNNRAPRIVSILAAMNGALSLSYYRRDKPGHSRIECYNPGKKSESFLDSIKIPKHLESFDNLLYQLGLEEEKLSKALMNIINRGATSNMDEVNTIIFNIVPLFSEAIIQYKGIIG